MKFKWFLVHKNLNFALGAYEEAQTARAAFITWKFKPKAYFAYHQNSHFLP